MTDSNLPATREPVDAMTLVGQAVQNGASMENVDKLIELVKFNDEREALREFNKAFTAAQSEFKPTFKSKSGHNSNYAPYIDVVENIRPVLFNHGLSFRHKVTERENRIVVTCVLSHSAGHSESAEMSAPPDKSGNKAEIQAVASTVTYLKRYTLEAVTGVASTDDDTDGHVEEYVSDETITESQAKHLESLVIDNNLDMDKWLDFVEKHTTIRAFSSIPITSYAKVENLLLQNIEKVKTK